jgi:pimeloyl-ACP methyl ester carboxylesterase
MVDMEKLLMDNLRSVVNYALTNSGEICGSKEPTLILAGHSAGASASAAVASEYPQISKLLLVAPSADIDPRIIRHSLSRFNGELFIISGDKDYVINPESAKTISTWATRAKTKKLFVVSDCDHDFSSQKGQKFLFKSYFWVFGKASLKNTYRKKNT